MWLLWLLPLPADKTIEKHLGTSVCFKEVDSYHVVMWLCLYDENTSLAEVKSCLSRSLKATAHGTSSAESHTSLTKEYKQVYGIKHPYN